MLSNTLALAFVIIFVSSEADSASVGGQKVDDAKMKEAAMILVNDCKNKVGASDEDLQMLRNKKMPQTPEGMCLVECFFNTVRVMKNGKFYKEGAIEVVEPSLRGNEEKIKKMKKMMEVCEKEIGDGDANTCVTAKMIVECTSKHGPEFGFALPSTV